MQSKSLRSGTVYGWYDPKLYDASRENRIYHCAFIDDDIINSFGSKETSEYNYIDHTSYSSAYCNLAMINKMFYSAFKQSDDYDNSGYHTLIIHSLYVSNHDFASKVGQHIFKESTGVSFVETAPGTKIYQCVIIDKKDNSYLNEFLEKAAYFLFILACKNGENIYIDDGMLSKYCRMTVQYNMPYHIRYILKIMMNAGFRSHPEYLKILQESSTEKIVMHQDYISNQRYKWVSSILNNNDEEFVIFDFGCGEGNYLDLSRKHPYIGIDIDKDAISRAEGKIGKKKYDNAAVVYFDDLANFLSQNQGNNTPAKILMTEMLEHMDKKDVNAFLERINSMLKHNGYIINEVLVTVPNYSFNKYFGMENGQFRHDDHKWEPTKTTFMALCLLISHIFKLRHIDSAGEFDTVNDEPVTLTGRFVL